MYIRVFLWNNIFEFNLGLCTTVDPRPKKLKKKICLKIFKPMVNYGVKAQIEFKNFVLQKHPKLYITLYINVL